MQDKHVVVIVYNTLSSACELSNNMYERISRARRVKPSLPQRDDFEQLRLFFLNQQDLRDISYTIQSILQYTTHFSRHLIATVSCIRTLIYPFNQIALNGSVVLWTLQGLMWLFLQEGMCFTYNIRGQLRSSNFGSGELIGVYVLTKVVIIVYQIDDRG